VVSAGLVHDSPHSVIMGNARYPVVCGIPYLRTGREELVATALDFLDGGNQRGALLLLLCDQDDWARTEPPDASALDALVDGRLNLRQAMRALSYGPVADYFAFRWSDPTFVSGLALLQQHLPVGASVLELGCGVGHYLREFAARGIQAIGADVVFSKLWLARQYLVSAITLVCFDAGSPFPLGDGQVGAVFCHDAFYFLPRKAHVAREMRRVAGGTGAVMVGHAHNAEAHNHSSGEPMTEAQYLALFPGSVVYDDAELTGSWIENRLPRLGAGRDSAALAFATGSGGVDFGAPSLINDAGLRLNPLFEPGDLQPRWPSERYRQEYAGLSGYLQLDSPPLIPTPELVRRRVFVWLPENW
jgi:SAM-dependent methyltransferase